MRHLPLALRAAFTALAATALTAGVLASGGAAQAEKNELNHHPVSFPVKEKAANRARPTRSKPLVYGGGVNGIGVTTGHEKVYVIFWGSQWGTSGTDAGGYTTLSGDANGMGPRLQAMIKGLGTNNELWSGVMTQYCEGVAKGATSCPAGSARVAYPTGGALAGVWVDPSAAAPSNATARQIGDEAVKAAAHFGNTTAAANRNAQYFIVSPSGTHPDGFNTPNGTFCAWHDYTGDPYVGSPSAYGDIAFTNAPYVTDMGSSCGQNYVNPGTAGTLDGVTMVMGHEYSEVVTDQNPAGGWTDSAGAENADKCSWIGTGGAGGSQNVAFATGSFAMQGTWSNDTNGCLISHAIQQ
ncbi:hypothetical protein Lfu02_41690 [Longispora fulva]|uniref:Serine protease n=1 Tax=Longispora fulva TaxID=619741 RepID=A0A8J7GHV7_9ACTN|nr:hypothetical protein [Longispora fulva]MBG6136628.1 hypothetical protein [Longispora fulva]GIG59797.1 hypothetical protein Lfu02_41690 [Longispora fulva]